VQVQPILENLAVAKYLALAERGLPEPQRRDAGGAVEGADEIGEVSEPTS